MNIVLDLSAPIFCILLCIGCAIAWFLWKKRNWQFRYWLVPVFMCYILMLIKVTLFPIHIFVKEILDKIMAGVGKYYVFYQVVPFASIKNYFNSGAAIQLVGNIALLSPLAVFAEIFSRQRPKAWAVALGVSSISIFIEITQLVINLATQYPNRVADVDDLMLNIAGIILTIFMTRCTGKHQNMRKVFQKVLYR